MEKDQTTEKDIGFEEDIDQSEKEKYYLFLKTKKSFENSEKLGKDEETFNLGQSYIYNNHNDNESQEFYFESRFISFINEEKNFKKKFFIYNQRSLDEALSKAMINNAIFKTSLEDIKQNYNSNNSNSSSGSAKSLKIEEIINKKIIIIKQEKPINSVKIFSKENFDKRFHSKKIADLDFNLKYYYTPIPDRRIDLRKESNIWFKEINDFYKNKKLDSELLIVGPRGVGKSTTILKTSNVLKIPRLYFPIKKIMNLDSRKWKKILLYEAIYILNNEEDMEEFKSYIETHLDGQDLIELIFEFIKLIINFYELKNVKKKILVVLDKYDNTLDSSNSILKITDYVHKKANKLLLCVLGECSYVYKKYYDYILDNNQNYNVTYWDIPIKDNLDYLKLPLYYYKNIESQSKNNNNLIIDASNKSSFYKLIKKEIKEDFNKISIKKFFSLSKYLNFYSDIRNAENEFENFPLEFLTLDIKKENDKIYFIISFKLNIYKEVFSESIKGILKIDNIRSNIILDKNNNNNEVSKNKDGIQFEEIIIEQLWNNQLGLDNIPENNKIIVNDIYSIKSFKDEGYNVEKNNTIIIRQSNFNGKYYDLLLIMNDKDKRIAIFIQIGINKTRYEINLYYNNLIRYHDEYKSGIGFLTKDKIDDIGFLLIFDYDKQISLKNKETEGIGYCLNNQIEYLVYRDFQLFDSLNSKEPISSIDAKKTIVSEALISDGLIILKNISKEVLKDMIELKYEPYVSIDESQKKKIIEYINSQYEQNFDDLEFVINIGSHIKGNINLGIFYNDFAVNIIEGSNGIKYFNYNNNIFKICKNNNNIKELTTLEENTFNRRGSTWDLYLLEKKRNRQKK